MNSTAKVLEVKNADPDYQNVQEESFSLGEVNESLHREDARDQAVQKIQKIIHEQFSFEIELKEKEVSTVNHRIHECRTTLDRLRACILAGYYGYGMAPGSRQGGFRMGRNRPTKSCLKEASLDDIMNWKKSLPSNLKEQVPDENLSSRNQTLVGSGQGTSASSSKFVSPSLFKPELVNENESRFYVKQRIIIGNTSKYILPEQREMNDRSTHKWMVYVRGPKDDGELQNFISKVWFLLHPSYQPNDLVEVCKPPFQVTRRGWGEFPVRVQLHFVENKNKRVDIIHHLKLDKTYTGLQTLGAETHVDVELDRKNFDGLKSMKPLVEEKRMNTLPQVETPAPVIANCFDLTLKLGQSGMVMDAIEQKGVKQGTYGFQSEHDVLNDHSYSTIPAKDKPSCDDNMKYPTPPTSVPGSKCSTPKSIVKHPVSFSFDTEIEPESDMLLQKGVRQFSIVKPEKGLNKPGYSSSSLEEFFAWNIGKRLAAEWQRALALKKQITKESDTLSLSTKHVMNYCRLHGYTPMVDVSSDGKTICKFCGEENDSEVEESDEESDDDDKPMFMHEECASEFEEEGIPEIYTTAQEFLEIIMKPKYPSVKREVKQEEVEHVDVVGVSCEQSPKDFSSSQLFFLPITAEFEWVQEIASEVDVSLTNCDINGVHAPVTSAMLYKACRMFVEDIVRKANRFTWKSLLQIPKAKCILPLHVKKALDVIPHCDFLTNKYLKVEVED